MKKLIFTLAFLATIATQAQKINPVTIGIEKVADSISVSVMTFKTTDKTCQLYFELFDESKINIDRGNLQLTEEEFSLWGDNNTYIEDLALTKLNLTRKQE